MKLILQSKSTTCGPACLAMVAGTTEEKILELLGNKFIDGLDHKYIHWALNKLYIPHSPWFRDNKWGNCKEAIIEYTWSGRKYIMGHYFVFYKNKFYDPFYGKANFPTISNIFSNTWSKVERYTEIYS